MSTDTGIIAENGEPIVKEEAPAPEAKSKIAVDAENKLTKIMGPDGKEHKVINSVTVMEIMVHKLENGQELSQVVAHEFMMVDHKTYMVKLLTEAINTVMHATKREPMVKLVGKAFASKLGFFKNRAMRTGVGRKR